MPIKVESVETLKKYFSKVVERAEHHAPNVNEIIYTLLGIIILKMDDNKPIEVWGTDNDATGNILWVTTGGNNYAFRYEHSNGGSIEIRNGSHKGTIKLRIDNATSVSTIISNL